MAISEIPIQRAPEPAGVKAVAGILLFPAFLLALAFLPLTALEARLLWDRPHYRFFPLVLAGAGVLIWSGVRSLGPLRPGGRRLAYLLAGLTWSLLATAALFSSPWLGAVAALIGFMAVAYGLGDGRLVRAVLPAWTFLWIALPPPLGLDRRIIDLLQTLATRWSSPLLDELGVLHLLEGHVVNIPGHRLLVEEACSGIHSLFAVLTCTLFFVLWTRRPPIRSFFLLVSAFVWVILGNIARVVAVAALLDRRHIDVSKGLSHDILGGVIFLLILALIASTDQLFYFLASLRRFPWNAPHMLLKSKSRESGPATAPARGPTVLLDPRRTWVTSKTAALAFGVLGVVEPLWLAPFLSETFHPTTTAIIHQVRQLDAGSLPGRSLEFERTGFSVERRAVEDQFGEESRVWAYRFGRHQAAAAVDYPFKGYHDLVACYRSQGWDVRERNVRHQLAPHGTESADYVEAVMEQPSGKHALLFYSLFDREGRAVEPASGPGRLKLLAHRLSFWKGLTKDNWAIRAGLPVATYQVQVIVQGDAPISAEERIQAQAFFTEVRRTVTARAQRGKGEVRP